MIYFYSTIEIIMYQWKERDNSCFKLFVSRVEHSKNSTFSASSSCSIKQAELWNGSQFMLFNSACWIQQLQYLLALIFYLYISIFSTCTYWVILNYCDTEFSITHKPLCLSFASSANWGAYDTTGKELPNTFLLCLHTTVVCQLHHILGSCHHICDNDLNST